MYTAVVLTPEAVQQVKDRFEILIPMGWDIKAHHMTCNMGKASNGPAATYLGQEVELLINSLAFDSLVLALGVTCEVPSSNQKPHITLAVNTAKGGKPVMSNSLTNWVELPHPLIVKGIVQEIA